MPATFVHERTVIPTRRHGSGNDIAKSLTVPRNQIASIIRLLRDRVRRRVGIEVLSAEPLADRPAPEVMLNLPVPRSSLAPAGSEAARQAVEQMAV